MLPIMRGLSGSQRFSIFALVAFVLGNLAVGRYEGVVIGAGRSTR